MSLFTHPFHRSAVYGTRGMVATSQPLAVAAGLRILERGGNAADAAVATAAALNVTEPTSTGIGGDAFALYYEAATGEVTALNASGRSPEALTLSLLEREGLIGDNGRIKDPLHAHTVTVPGACAGWCDLIERHGNRSIAEVLEPAISLAECGFPVAPITAHAWARGVADQLRKTRHGQELTIEGRAPVAGEIFRNPGLARTLRTVAEGGRQSFYEGAIAEAMVAEQNAAGGVLSLSDLADHRSTWDHPISTTYRGHRIWECPPNGQGLAVLLALNLLEGIDLAALPPLSPERLHWMIEAMRLGFADTRWFTADPSFSKVPLAELLSKAYAAERRSRMDPFKATLDQRHGSPVAGSDTVYLAVVDETGNACSFINSNYMGFGTGIVPAGWGFTLQNRGHNFFCDPAHPNALYPGKRPYHTIIPGLITRDRKDGTHDLCGPFGVMGGFMQPQGHVQVVVGLLDDQRNPQEALDHPRFCLPNGESGDPVALEEGTPSDTVEALAALGHSVELVGGERRSLFGRGQVILRDPDSRVLCGGSDPRADGCAMPRG